MLVVVGLLGIQAPGLCQIVHFRIASRTATGSASCLHLMLQARLNHTPLILHGCDCSCLQPSKPVLPLKRLPSQAVKKMSKAHTTLRHEAERWSAGKGVGLAGQGMGWAAVQAEGQDASLAQGTNASFPLLTSIMDPGLSLERSAHAAQVHLFWT